MPADALMVATAVAEAAQSSDRELGSRGSRAAIENSAASDLTPTAAAVLAAIPAWWSARAQAAGLSGRWLDVTQAVDAAPPIELPVDDALVPSWGLLTPDQVGAAYVSSLSAATRARHGRHYTPVELADHLWWLARNALGFSPRPERLEGLVRDPACGAGALLLPALREHLRASYDIEPALALTGLPNVIEGIDNDPAAVWVANVVLAAEALATLARVPESLRRPVPAMARVGDGLAVDLSPAKVVLMNPPYGRVKLSDDERSRFAHVLYGHANIYGMFMARGVDQLESGGVLASLTPTSFTSGRYFERLREHLGQQTPLTQITFVSDRSGVFSSVLQETCLATFEKRARRKVHVRSFGSKVEDLATVAVQRSSAPWMFARRSDDAVIAATCARFTSSLASLGWRASTGPLVWNRRTDDLSAQYGKSRSHVVWAADIDGGSLHRDSGRDSMRYLALTKPSDERVMVLREPAVLVQRTTAPEQSRRLVVAPLTQADLDARGGGVTVENHVNVLRPQGLLASLSVEQLARILGTRTMDQVVRTISGSVALSAYELESIPMPLPEVVATWAELAGDELEDAVRRAYQGQEPVA